MKKSLITVVIILSTLLLLVTKDYSYQNFDHNERPVIKTEAGNKVPETNKAPVAANNPTQPEPQKQEQSSVTVVPNEIIVKLKPGQDVSKIPALKDKTKDVEAGPVYTKISLQDGVDSGAVLKKMQQDNTVELAEPVHTYKISATFNDTNYASEWYMDKIKAPVAYDNSGKLQPIRVAVVDTGVSASHPDLSGKVIAEYNAITRTAGPGQALDVHGHGTHVAGIIAATANNNTGIAGVSPNAQILAVKAAYPDGSLYDFDIVNGIHWAVQNGAKVINMSFGSSGYSQVIANEVNYALSQGVVMVAAAGNDGLHQVSYPAALPGVIAVSASDSSDNLASFSNYGPQIAVAAPGVSIYSTYYNPSTATNTYAYMSGTSMATPMVTAEAAVILGTNPGYNPSQVSDIIKQNSVDLGTPGRDDSYGNGRIDISRAIMPFRMWIDSPYNATTVRGNINVSGWGLNYQGISAVEVDTAAGVYNVTNINIPRSDLNSLFPGYPVNNGGFAYTLDTTALPNGWQTITVKITATNGEISSRTIWINVNNPPVLMWIDAPGNGSAVRGIVNVSGWALDMTGISSVQVNTAAGVYNVTNKNLPRADLGLIFPGYPSANNGGFSYPLNTTQLPNGWQTITVKITTLKGVTSSQTIWINVNNPPMILWTDLPYNGGIIRGTVNVSGWVVSKSTIASIQVNTAAGSNNVTTMNQPRADVNALFPGYVNSANSAFSYSLNTVGLPNGWQTISVTANGMNNEKQTRTLWVYVDNAPKLWLDTPGFYSTISGNVNVSGWALAATGIKDIKVNTAAGVYDVTDKAIARADIPIYYPGYANSANSGFSYPLDTTALPNGWQTITIVATSNSNEVLYRTVWVNVKNSPMLMWVDTPLRYSTISGTVNVSGWAMNNKGITSVQVHTAAGVYNVTNKNILAGDLVSIFPSYPTNNGRYTYPLDTRVLPNGWQTITVLATGANGETASWVIWVNVVN